MILDIGEAWKIAILVIVAFIGVWLLSRIPQPQGDVK